MILISASIFFPEKEKGKEAGGQLRIRCSTLVVSLSLLKLKYLPCSYYSKFTEIKVVSSLRHSFEILILILKVREYQKKLFELTFTEDHPNPYSNFLENTTKLIIERRKSKLRMMN